MYKQITFSKPGKPYNYTEFLCDTTNDLENLPTNKNSACAIGSIAFVLNPRSTYILNNKNEYELLPSDSGGGGGNIDPSQIATDAEITEMLTDVFG